MNDFTKEELQYIATLFKFVEVGYLDYKLDEELWIKIETMIDNYCEHEWENTCCSCDLNRIWCHKCNGDLGHLETPNE